jgi:hypothetical protein
MADVVVTMSGDVADILRKQQRVIDKNQMQIDKLKDTVKASKRFGSESQKASSRAAVGMAKTEKATGKLNTALGKISKFALPALAVAAGAAVAKVLSELNQIKQAADEIGDTQTASFDASAQLASLAGGDPKKLASLRARQKAIFSQGGAKSLDEAANLVFALDSASITGQDKLFGQISKSKIVEDTASFAKSANTLQTSLGKEEAGTIREITSKALAASSFSPASADKILDASAKAGSLGGGLNVRDESILAGTAILSKATGSAEQAGTQIKALLAELSKKEELFVDDLRTSIVNLDKLSGPEISKAIGSIEAIQAVRVLAKNIDTFDTAVDEIDNAQKSDLIGKTVRLFESDPELRAISQEQIAKNRSILANKNIGTKDNQIDTIRTQRATQRLEEGGESLLNRVIIGTEEKGFETLQILGGEDFTLRTMRQMGSKDAANLATPIGQDSLQTGLETGLISMFPKPIAAFKMLFNQAEKTSGPTQQITGPQVKPIGLDLPPLGQTESNAAAGPLERAAKSLQQVVELQRQANQKWLDSLDFSQPVPPQARPQFSNANRLQQAVPTE